MALACWGLHVMQEDWIKLHQFQFLWTESKSCLLPLPRDGDALVSALVLRQPGRQIRGRLKIQEGIGQGFQFGERQPLDAGLLLGSQAAEAAL